MLWIKRNSKYLYLFVLFVILSFCISTFVIPLYNGDEVWNYGFSYNISSGLIPYRDFSMLQTPVYFYIGSIFINVFGNYLYSMHIFDSLYIALIMLMLYKSFGKRSFFIYPFLLILLIPSYNLFCLFLLFLIIYLDYDKKDNDLLNAFIVGLIFMTKQSIGVTMFLPMIFYSKNKIKSILVFLIPFSVFSIYFVFNGAFFDFIDHCFLGMIDFNEKNKFFSFFMYVEIIQSLYIIYLLFKSRFKEKILFYILAFQIVSYPIFEVYHYMVALIPFLYYLMFKSELKKPFNLLFFVVFLGISISVIIGNVNNLINSKILLFRDKSNYLYGRNIYIIDSIDLKRQTEIINSYNNSYNYKFFIVQNTYLRKLYMDEEINRYDLLLNGNMGYKGYKRIINDFNEICQSNSCVFFVEKNLIDNGYSQFNKDIYNYVINNYILEKEYKYFNVYVNGSEFYEKN